MEGSSLWFVIPCYGRVELTRLCLGQLASLRDKGIDLDAVIVADDENLDTAKELGFHAIGQTPDYLGRKYNDGYQYARSLGAKTLVQWASDNWVSPNVISPIGPNEIVVGHSLALVDEKGERLAILDVRDRSNPYGAGPFMFSANLLPRSGRPLDDEVTYGLDRHLVERLISINPVKFVLRDYDALQLVGFKSEGSLTTFDQLLHLAIDVYDDPFERLADKYPLYLVEGARGIYGR